MVWGFFLTYILSLSLALVQKISSHKGRHSAVSGWALPLGTEIYGSDKDTKTPLLEDSEVLGGDIRISLTNKTPNTIGKRFPAKL